MTEVEQMRKRIVELECALLDARSRLEVNLHLTHTFYSSGTRQYVLDGINQLDEVLLKGK